MSTEAITKAGLQVWRGQQEKLGTFKHACFNDFWLSFIDIGIDIDNIIDTDHAINIDFTKDIDTNIDCDICISHLNIVDIGLHIDNEIIIEIDILQVLG